MTMSSGKDDSSEDEGNKKWNGDSAGLEDFDKKVARWCRRKYGTEVGNFLWENDVPDITEMGLCSIYDATAVFVRKFIISAPNLFRSGFNTLHLAAMGLRISRKVS